MSQAIQANPQALVESVARGLSPSSRDDFRNLMNLIVLGNLTALSPGGNLPVQIGGPKAGSSAPPTGVTHSVVGANGQYTVAIQNPSTPPNTQIFHEVSYSPLKSFTQNVTTLQPTTQTSIQIPLPAGNNFVRLRSSFDQKTWTPYQLSSVSAIDAGLVGSSATTAGAAFNQTNFAQVNSAASGSSAIVTVSGPTGTLTSYTAVRGTTQAVRPSATIVGVEPESEQFVGYDGSSFHLKPTLASVLADDLEPVGKVSVVSTAPPTPPVITPIVTAGSVLGYHVVSGGSGATQDYTLTVVGGGGTGATTGQQTIQNGVLISVAPGDAGTGYGGGTSVTVTGGGPGGSGGGGTATGGNGGRMTDV